MKLLRIENRDRGVDLTGRCIAADNFWLRLRGLLGRPPLQPGDGLLITPCRGVHMVGMRYPIDVVFIDAGQRIVGLCPDLGPGARSSWYRNARHALELPAGTIAATGTRIGDAIRIESVDDPPSVPPRSDPVGQRNRVRAE